MQTRPKVNYKLILQFVKVAEDSDSFMILRKRPETGATTAATN